MIKNRLLTCTLFIVLASSGLFYGTYSGFSFSNNYSFAQESNTSSLADSSTLSNTSEFVQFNNYENNDLGISLKYPSNFLIDESNSNETFKQVSFFPVDNATTYPENNIQWIGVFVKTLDSNPQSLSSLFNSSSSSLSNTDIGTYLENLANSIQQENQDVTIIEASTNASLSGHPSYKLVTESYFGNYSIYDIEIGTITDNKLYSLDYEVDPSNYQNSLPTANVIIESFKILPITSNGDFNLEQQLLDTKSTVLPLLSNILSSLKLDNFSNESSSIFKTLNNSMTNSVNDVLTNTSTKINESLMNSSSPSSSDTLDKICNLPLISKLCGINIGGNDSMTGFQDDSNASFLRNGTDDIRSSSSDSIEKKINNLFGFLGFSDNSTRGLTNMSDFNKLIGPLNSFSQSSQSPNLSSIFSSLDPRTNNSFLNLTETGSAANQYVNNSTNDVLKMLEFLQGR